MQPPLGAAHSWPNGQLGMDGSIRDQRELSLLYSIALKQYHSTGSFLTNLGRAKPNEIDLSQPRP